MTSLRLSVKESGAAERMIAAVIKKVIIMVIFLIAIIFDTKIEECYELTMNSNAY